jgi:hypothetical protein
MVLLVPEAVRLHKRRIEIVQMLGSMFDDAGSDYFSVVESLARKEQNQSVADKPQQAIEVIDDDLRIAQDTQPTASPSKKPEIQSKLVVPTRTRESARPSPPQFDEDEYDTDELILMGSPTGYTDNAQNARVEIIQQIQEGTTTLEIVEF